MWVMTSSRSLLRQQTRRKAWQRARVVRVRVVREQERGEEEEEGGCTSEARWWTREAQPVKQSKLTTGDQKKKGGVGSRLRRLLWLGQRLGRGLPPAPIETLPRLPILLARMYRRNTLPRLDTSEHQGELLIIMNALFVLVRSNTTDGIPILISLLGKR